MTAVASRPDVAARRRVALFALAAVAVFGAFHLQYVLRVRPDVVYMDTLRMLLYYDDIQRGAMSFFGSWNLGAHRGLIAQGLLHLNIDLFHLDILGANIASGAVLAVTAILLARLSIGGVPAQDPAAFRRYAIVQSAVILVAMFSLAGFELLTLDYGLVLFTKNLVLIAFWAFVDRTLRASPPRWWTTLPAAIVGAALIMTVAMGWSYAFTMVTALLAVNAWWRAPAALRATIARHAVVLLAVMAAAQFAYIRAGSGTGVFEHFQGGNAEASLPLSRLVESILLGASSVFAGNEFVDRAGIPDALQLLAGGVLLATVCAAFLARLCGRGGASGLPDALMVYGLASIAAVSVARGRVDPDIARSSRYFMDYGLIMVGLCWAVWRGAREGARMPPWLARAASAGTAICVVLFLAGQAFTQVAEWRKAPYRAASIAEMRATTLCGPRTDADAALLQAVSLPVAQRAVSIQARQGLAVFRGRPMAAGCSRDEVGYGPGWYSQEGQGRWMGARAEIDVHRCDGVIALQFYRPGTFPPARVQARLGNEPAMDVLLAPGEVVSIEIDSQSGKSGPLVLTVDAPWTPSADAPDQRVLGALLGGLEDIPGR